MWGHENMNEYNNNQNNTRTVPANDLDLQFQVTEPTWQQVSKGLDNKLSRSKGFTTVKNDKGEDVKVEVREYLSGILAVYTRDMRLGNLSAQEFEYVAYYVDLAVDLLEEGYASACVIALNKALSRLEISSSKGGFLRKLFRTARNENVLTSLEPPKKNPFGGNK